MDEYQLDAAPWSAFDGRGRDGRVSGDGRGEYCGIADCEGVWDER